MKKLSLDIDQLNVESFDAAPTSKDDGTVVGHDITPACTGPNCDTGDNCSLGCGTIYQCTSRYC